MKNSSFLGTAEARADHLRELSTHVRELSWTSASLREAEDELPELDVAISVYRRLSPEGNDAFDATAPHAFLSLAEGRADHLRQVTEHLQALDCEETSLSDIDAELPELETAMTVYRRLTGEAAQTEEADDPRPSAPAAAPFSFSVNSAIVRSAPELDEPEAPAGTSFSQFARRLGDPGNSAGAGSLDDTEPNGSR
jgi:hypothetical protein